MISENLSVVSDSLPHMDYMVHEICKQESWIG